MTQTADDGSSLPQNMPKDPGAYQSMRSTVLRAFNDPREKPTRPAPAGRFTETEKYYTMVTDVNSKTQFMAWSAVLILHGSSSSMSHAQWKSYVLTVSDFFMGSFRTETLASIYSTTDVAMDSARCTQIVDCLRLLDEADTPQATIDTKAALLTLLPVLPDLPDIDTDKIVKGLHAALMHDLGSSLVYGWASLVFFLAGKSITKENRAAITEKRPNAILNKLDVGSEVNASVKIFLTGTMRLSDTAHTFIHTSWTMLNDFRQKTFLSIVPYMHDNSLAPDMSTFFINARLMEYSGMQLVMIIDKFLTAVPESVEVPLFAPALQNYYDSLRQLSKIDAKIRPYAKLIYGDTNNLFHRNKLEALMVIAVDYDKKVNPSMSSYNLPINAPQIRTQYEAQLQILRGLSLEEEETSAVA